MHTRLRVLLSLDAPSYVIETPDKLPCTLTLTNKSVNSCSSSSTSSASHITDARSKTHLTHRQTPQRAHETSIPCRRQTLDSPCKDISIRTPRTVAQSSPLPPLTSLSLLETHVKRRGTKSRPVTHLSLLKVQAAGAFGHGFRAHEEAPR